MISRRIWRQNYNDICSSNGSGNEHTVRLGYNELGYNKLGYNELGYNELGYNELGYNEHSVNELFSPI